jgi:thioredoxin reductase
MSDVALREHPVAIVGAGPVGLAAAAHLASKGEKFVVLEGGASVGAHVSAWAHVQVFSPWRYNVDPVAVTLLKAAGWKEPDPDVLPTGGEIVAEYLRPLAQLPQMAPYLRFGRRAQSVARVGFDKMKTAGREQAPFVLQVDSHTGRETVIARAVIDASGTYGTPNPLGSNGLPALGEPDCNARVFYGIPDVLGRDRDRYAGRATLVVGSGHSAFNALLDLAELATIAAGTTITWAIRRSDVGAMYGGGNADALPARGSLGARLRALVDSGRVRLVSSFGVVEMKTDEAGVIVIDGQRRALGPVDQVIAVTGFRPDLTMLSELRLDLDSAVESPRQLASLIDPNVHSCGTVPPHGAEELRRPEPDFYVVGMKSYGRAPTFLMLTGYEQVRSVVAALTGDIEAARRVELTLPATGVCSATPADRDGTACCNVTPAAIDAGACCDESLNAPAGTSCCAPTPQESSSACCATPRIVATALAPPQRG